MQRLLYFSKNGAWVQDSETFRMKFLSFGAYQKQKNKIIKTITHWKFENQNFKIQEYNDVIKVFIKATKQEYKIHYQKNGVYCNKTRLAEPAHLQLAVLNAKGEVKIFLWKRMFAIRIKPNGHTDLINKYTNRKYYKP